MISVTVSSSVRGSWAVLPSSQKFEEKTSYIWKGIVPKLMLPTTTATTVVMIPVSGSPFYRKGSNYCSNDELNSKIISQQITDLEWHFILLLWFSLAIGSIISRSNDKVIWTLESITNPGTHTVTTRNVCTLCQCSFDFGQRKQCMPSYPNTTGWHSWHFILSFLESNNLTHNSYFYQHWTAPMTILQQQKDVDFNSNNFCIMHCTMATKVETHNTISPEEIFSKVKGRWNEVKNF